MVEIPINSSCIKYSPQWVSNYNPKARKPTLLVNQANEPPKEKKTLKDYLPELKLYGKPEGKKSKKTEIQIKKIIINLLQKNIPYKIQSIKIRYEDDQGAIRKRDGKIEGKAEIRVDENQVFSDIHFIINLDGNEIYWFCPPPPMVLTNPALQFLKPHHQSNGEVWKLYDGARNVDSPGGKKITYLEAMEMINCLSHDPQQLEEFVPVSSEIDSYYTLGDDGKTLSKHSLSHKTILTWIALEAIKKLPELSLKGKDLENMEVVFQRSHEGKNNDPDVREYFCQLENIKIVLTTMGLMSLFIRAYDANGMLARLPQDENFEKALISKVNGEAKKRGLGMLPQTKPIYLFNEPERKPLLERVWAYYLNEESPFLSEIESAQILYPKLLKEAAKLSHLPLNRENFAELLDVGEILGKTDEMVEADRATEIQQKDH